MLVGCAFLRCMVLFGKASVLSSVGAVVHEKELNVLGVLDEESLVAGGHHVLGLLVGAIADLSIQALSVFIVPWYESQVRSPVAL